MQNQRRKKKSNFLKKTSKLPQKYPDKEKSLDTQQTNSGQRAVKMDDYAEGGAGHASM